jgi:hypothetical protein
MECYKNGKLHFSYSYFALHFELFPSIGHQLVKLRFNSWVFEFFCVAFDAVLDSFDRLGRDRQVDDAESQVVALDFLNFVLKSAAQFLDQRHHLFLLVDVRQNHP